MDTEDRPNPDELLAVVQKEEGKLKRGRLKIFLGMEAGVGKTYAMLQEAQSLRKKGIDVVVGIVDTHGRSETAALLKDLKIIPEKIMCYKGSAFPELDVDEVIKSKPELALIDELAHSNVPGSKHQKRYEDVLELLDNGIDVYTTLNVQHIESLKELIEGITGIAVRETVPDSIIEAATYIEIIDITTEELLQRLKDGKVYLGNQPEIAARNFFQEDRLTALREMVLRFAAEKVDHDLHGMVSTFGYAREWRPRERLLVAISHSPHSQKLIRTTRRLAFTLDAPWIALNVNDGRALDDSEKRMLEKNIGLARDLGAEVITINAVDISQAIQMIARQKHVTQIIIGRPPKKSFFEFFQRYDLLEKLERECKDIDVLVIRQEPFSTPNKSKIKFSISQQPFTPYIAICFFIALFSCINWFLAPFLGFRIIGFIFVIEIFILSLYFKKSPIFFGCCLFALIWDYAFIPPVGSFQIESSEDRGLFVLYFFTAIATGFLVVTERMRKEMFLSRERRIHTLYEIVRTIAGNTPRKKVFTSIKEKVNDALYGTCEIFCKQKENAFGTQVNTFLGEDEKEKNALKWVFENGKEAGWSTSTLPLCHYLYIPIKKLPSTIGVLAFRPKNPDALLSFEDMNFLYTVGQELASFIERAEANEVETMP